MISIQKYMILSLVLILSFGSGARCDRKELYFPRSDSTASIKDIAITESGGSTLVTEGGTPDYYTIALAGEPDNVVQITVTPSSHISVNGSLTPILVYFTPDNWYLSHTITVAGFNDNVAESTHDGTITHSVESLDAEYNAISVRTVTCTVIDNDSPGVDIAASGGSTTITEGLHSDSYSITLTTQPLSDVVIAVSPDSNVTVNGSVSPIILTFTAGICPTVGNWCTPRVVTVDTIDNSVAEGIRTGKISNTVAAGPPDYLALNSLPDVDVTIIDNDTPGVTMDTDYLQIAEGGVSASYDIVLNMEPTDNVTITVYPDSQVTVNGASIPTKLDFTAGTCPVTGNWCVPQQVIVTAIDDSIVEGTHAAAVSHRVSGLAKEYRDLHWLPDVIVSISDND